MTQEFYLNVCENLLDSPDAVVIFVYKKISGLDYCIVGTWKGKDMVIQYFEKCPTKLPTPRTEYVVTGHGTSPRLYAHIV